MGSKLRPPQHSHGLAEVRRSCYQDVISLEDRLRPADLLEIKAAGTNARDGLTDCLLSSSKAFTVTLDGKPIAIFGVSPIALPGLSVGALWMMGTPDIESIKFQFLRESRKWLGEVSEGYDLLTNFVHANNELHIKWLRWLGVSIIRRQPPFLEFALICAT
jgi:hypothetical protein